MSDLKCLPSDQPDSHRSHSILGEFDGYCISLWTDFWLILLSNKLNLGRQKQGCGWKNTPRIQALLFVFWSLQVLQSCRQTWRTWPKSWIAARASPSWSTNSLSRARSSPRWESLFFAPLSDFDWHTDNTIFLNGVFNIFFPYPMCPISRFPLLVICRMKIHLGTFKHTVDILRNVAQFGTLQES